MPFSYREQAPPESLAQWVECQWRVESAVEIPHYGVAPDGCLDIVFSTSGGLRAIGTMTAERRYHLPGGERMCGVRFRPGMAGAFLKAEAAELTDAEAPLEDLWGAPARRLAERMHEARTTADAAAALAAALRPPTPPDNVQRAVAAIAAAHGAVDVDQLAWPASARGSSGAAAGRPAASPRSTCAACCASVAPWSWPPASRGSSGRS